MAYFISIVFKIIVLPLLHIAPLTLTNSSINFGLSKTIAIVEVKGVITDEVREETVKQLSKYRRSRNVRAIILRIDSPGGGVAASQEIFNEIKRIRTSSKPIYASMGSVAASGGYYIAAPCDKIFANPGTITGSIGVIMEMANVEELLKKIGVYFMVIKSEEHKDIGSPFRKMTEHEEKLLKDVINDVYHQFVDAVVLERGLKKEDVLKVADGRIISGKQAVELGLVDELGGLYDVITAAAKEVGIKGKPKIVKPKRKPTLLELIGVKTVLKEYIGSVNLQYR